LFLVVLPVKMYEKKSGKAGASVVEKFRKFSDTF